MTNLQIIAQILGIFVIIICLVFPHFKHKSSMLLGSFFANLLWSAGFLLTNAFAGASTGFISLIRSITFYFYSKKDRVPPLSLLIIFSILQIALVIYFWNGWFCAFLLLAPLRTYGEWQKKENKLRGIISFTTFFNGIYCIFSGNYTNAVNEWVQSCSSIIATIRYRKIKN